MKVLLATGDQALDAYLSKHAGIQEVGRAVFAEQLVGLVPSLKPDVVLFSETIPISRLDQKAAHVGAESNILNIMETIVEEGIRVVMIINDRPPGHPFLERLIGLGIYDLVIGDTVNVEQVIDALHHPGTRKKVKHLLHQESMKSDDAYRAKEIKLVADQEEKSNHQPVGQKVLGIVKSVTDVKETIKQKWDLRAKVFKPPEELTNDDTSGSESNLKKAKGEPEQVIILYSPESTGKTFVGINLAIALAKQGKRVHYMDESEKVKYWFNAPHFPFVLEGFSLRVSGMEKSLDADVVVVETRKKETVSRFPNALLFVVVDSDLSHQIEVSKSLESLSPLGMVWNLADQVGNPKRHIHLPTVAVLPWYLDTFERIEEGIPRAFTDSALCDELLKVYLFDPMDDFVLNRGVPL